MALLTGKTALVMGVANRWSIATAIAKALHDHGARLVLTYEGERTKPECEKLGGALSGALVACCDVCNDQSLVDLRAFLESNSVRLDGVVHSLAFARKEELAGKFYGTSREGFKLALDISAYSLVALCRELQPLL